jgi:cation diffusion facilitator CzcD-associated flavoprotein CzcO
MERTPHGPANVKRKVFGLSDESKMRSEMTSNHDDVVDVVVVGAGFAGLYAVHRLHQFGLSFRAYEAAPSVGGTWYWNRYPGARCDLESIYYSYSFSPELDQDWNWTERYASQPELLRYLEHVADRFDLRRHFEFETTVTAAVFDEGRRRWLIETDRGDHVAAQFCVMATGCLSVPRFPDVKGISDFEGDSFHTANWPEGDVDLTGKQVAVVGTGSSGIQCIPIIAQQASHLTVFQRTPSFSFPARNAPMDPAREATVKENYVEQRAAARESGFGVPVIMPVQSAFDVTGEERVARYERGWEEGGLFGIVGAFNDLLVNRAANETAADFARSKIHQIVVDPTTAEILSPTGYPVGAKRACLDTHYYQTFNLENVSVVDTRHDPIESITAQGIRTADQTHEFDAIVFATGFDAMTGALLRIDISGRDGLRLSEKWLEGPRTYLGLAVPGFPNLFMVTGPGSPSVRSNMVVSIEQHVEWITECVNEMIRRGVRTIEATEVAEAAWVDHVRETAEATLFPQADSWYNGSNVPGKPRVYMPYVGGVGQYRIRCARVAANGYEGFVMDSGEADESTEHRLTDAAAAAGA